MPPSSTQLSYLNEQECWNLWFELGTLKNVQENLFERGIENPVTGKAFSRYAIQIAAWRYACKNVEQAKLDFKADMEKQGFAWNDSAEQNFYARLMKGSKRCIYGRKRMDKFIEENNLEQYRKYI